MVNRLIRILLVFCLIGATLDAVASQIQYLHKDWKFGQVRLPNRYSATVPGVVHLDLIDNNLIDDPFFRMNEKSVQWIDKEDWVYETKFIPSEEIISSGNIEIVFDGLDTYADVYLNDVKIIEADNMFRRWTANIKTHLIPGENRLKVYFHSPIKIDLPKWDRVPYLYNASNDQSENGGLLDRKLSVFARKAGYHYGWDWGPRLVTSGIWRSVKLRGWNNARISDVNIRQHNISEKKAILTNIIKVEADTAMANVVVSVKDEGTGKILASKKCNLSKGINMVSLDFTIKNPRLWWCNGLGSPELYTFGTSVIWNGKAIASETKRTGLRSVNVVTDPDVDGKMQFYFVLNGVPVFAKGTNYIPQDNFLPRVTPERYLTTLRDAADANMNMIRIWGGGIYENDIFYDICDELGLMVWQDFMFACSVYPATGEWLESVRQEAIENVCRLRNHPSVVLWCGGNECLDAWYNWGWKRSHEKNNPEYVQVIEDEVNRLYFETLPDVVSEYAPETFYWPSSPFTAQGQGSDGVNGDRHYWTVWHRKGPIDSYNKDRSHFFSEYGMQSFPEFKAIKRFAPDPADHSIDSEVMMSHQRGGLHANQLIQWYLINEYREPTDFKEFLYMNQVMQGDAMRTAIEAHRRDMPYCMGSLLWQHNDCWPVASWSTRDYYGNWKAAHYLVKKAFNNVIVSASTNADSLKVYVVSDLLKSQKGVLKLTLFSLTGSKLYETTSSIVLHANTSSLVWEEEITKLLNGADPTTVVLNASISTDGYHHAGNFYLCKQQELQLPQAQLKHEIHPIAGGYEVVLTADNFVRALWLSVDSEENAFDDNYFDLLPGIKKSCTIKSSLPAEEFKAKLAMRSLNGPLTLSTAPTDKALEAKVAKTLSSMTLDEKIGQMTQLQVDVLGTYDSTGNLILSKEKMDTIFGVYKVGSILNTPSRGCLDANQWNKLISQIQAYSIKEIGIPCIYGLDQIHGASYSNGGTLFPQSLNMAAAFDPALVKRTAEITAYETRACNCPWVFAPTLDLARDPRWSRFWENYGEDPLVNARMGAAAVQGFQGDNPNSVDANHVAVSLKHYLGYGSPFSGKDRTPAYISPSDLREKHFAPFLEAIKSGALTIMVNSSSINGFPVHADFTLLTRWLKEDLQWDGMIITDWSDINNLYKREKIAKDKKDAIRMAINAGIDMSMEPYSVEFCTLLKELVEEGAVPMNRIDDAAARVIRLKYRLGLFDHPNTTLKEHPEFGSKRNAEEALSAAEQTIVLLKNDNQTLPIKSGQRILLTGPTAHSMRTLNGGWSYTWQGHRSDHYAKDYNTIYEAFCNRFGKENIDFIPTVTFKENGSYDDEQVMNIDKAITSAADADIIVICIGENSYCETPGNLSNLHLSSLQCNMVKSLASTGKPIVFILNEGRPRIIADIEPLASAIVNAILPGNFGGDALSRLLAGDCNFSAKLPFTYPREINSLVTYDYKASEEVGKMVGAYDYDARINVQWPFGYGKSYTTFKYSNFQIDKNEFTASDKLTFSIDITNAGEMEGKETILLFSSDLVASIVPDNKRLRAFNKVSLKPGETRTVSLTIPASDLAFVNADGNWVLESGEFKFSMGSHDVIAICTSTHRWQTPNQ